MSRDIDALGRECRLMKALSDTPPEAQPAPRREA
jgi:hypothetical protein